MGKLYGIGVGPEDPELLTLEAHRVLNETGVIFCPEKETGAGSFAFDIIKGLLENTEAKIVNLVYPMYYHGAQLREMWKQNAGYIAEYSSGERTGAFITLGDSAVHSTFMYTLPCIEIAGMEVEVVPGIISFCAAADPMKMPLVAWNEDLVVVPVRKSSSEDLGRALREHSNVVLMKFSIGPEALLRVLEENHLENRFVLITKTGTGEECLVADFGDLKQYDIPYLSTVIIKKQGRQQ